MHEKEAKLAVERFLKAVSFNAHREVEKAVLAALKSGKVRPGESLTTGVHLTNDKIGLDVTIFAKLDV